jgi:integration host factor subunit alpha
MTKQDIVNKVALTLDIKANEAMPIVEAILEVLKTSMENGINVEISGFGKFVIRQKSMRIGRNPKTGMEAEISRRKVVTFKPSKLFRDAVNNSR